MTQPPPRSALAASAGQWAAGGFLLVAAYVHVAAVPVHADQWALSAVFFAVLAASQAALAVAVLAGLGDGRRVAGHVVALNAATVSLWAVSRLAGLPFGPAAGQPEAVGTADLIATGAEVLSLLAAAVLARTGGAHAGGVGRQADLTPRSRPARARGRAGLRPRLVHHVVGATLTAAILAAAAAAAQPSLAAHDHAGHDHAKAHETPRTGDYGGDDRGDGAEGYRRGSHGHSSHADHDHDH